MTQFFRKDEIKGSKLSVSESSQIVLEREGHTREEAKRYIILESFIQEGTRVRNLQYGNQKHI